MAHAKRAAKIVIKLYSEIILYISLEDKTPNMVCKLILTCSGISRQDI